jgi:diguanylate cyclase (GGDEF)-like protein/PAS domain S-box-containing protein
MKKEQTSPSQETGLNDSAIELAHTKKLLAQFKSLLDALPDPIFMKDESLRWIYGNPSILKLYAIDPNNYIGKTECELLPAEFAASCMQSDEVAKNTMRVHIAEEQARDDHGNLHFYEVYKVPFETPAQVFGGLIGVGRDITDRKQAQEELATALEQQRYLAEHDDLTGLLNLRSFKLEFQRIVPDCRYLILISIDRFSDFNDLFGHNAGDILLQSFARSLQALSPEKPIARIGAKEFALLMAGDLGQVNDSVQRFLATSSLPHQHEVMWSIDYQQSISVGIAEVDTTDTALTALARADAALHQAKRIYSNSVCIYNESHKAHIQQQASERNQLLSILSRQNAMLPYFQPIIMLADPQQNKAEVLLRFVDEQGKVFFDCNLIKAAEHYGIIDRISRRIVELSFAQQKQWRDCGINIELSINLSALDLVNDTLCHWIARHADDVGVSAKNIIFEVTESQSLPILEKAANNIAYLKSQGFRLALDDFGVGFTSFDLLKKYPFDLLKIDGAFVRGLVESREDVAIVKALQAVSKEFQIKTIAECVENETTYQAVQALNIDGIQGCYFAKAMSAKDYEQYIRANSATTNLSPSKW